MYIAGKRLKVGHDEETDTPLYREIGQPVPEAETWPWHTREIYLREGRLSTAPESTADHSAPAPKRGAKGTTHA